MAWMRAPRGLDSRMLASIEEIVHAAADRGQVPGAVAALARGDDVHVIAAGEATVGGPPMRPDTLMRISSLTKPITAAGVLSLAGDGLLDLDEPVDRLLPELAGRRVLRSPDGPLTDTVPASRAVTVRDLLTFTWGFGMQGAMFTAARPWPVFTATVDRQLSTFGPPQPAVTPEPDVWMARLGELPLLAQPGERWLYQSGSQVLGVLAARAAGAPLGEVLRERVFTPLGMGSTAFHTTAFDPTGTARLATAYERRDGRFEVTDPPGGQWSRPPAFPDGGAGLLSCAADLVAFGQMLLRGGGPVLAPELAAAMTRDQLTPRQRANVWAGFNLLGDRGWGYGLSVRPDGRYGWEGGSGTVWVNDPLRDLTVVVLTQRATDETGMPAVLDAVIAATAT